MDSFKKITGLTIFIFLTTQTFGQIKQGKITYERRTNLMKLYGNDRRMRNFINDENKIVKETFELYFNDSTFNYRLEETDDVDDENWIRQMTTKNKVQEKINQDKKLIELGVPGQKVFVVDSISKRNWQITESKRHIGKYHCRKAVYQKNDSTRIYAWFAVEIEPSTGPEGFGGLPGAILGLASEDGGIVYFATKVEELQPTAAQLSLDPKKQKVYTIPEFKVLIDEQFGKTEWGKYLFDGLFRWL